LKNRRDKNKIFRRVWKAVETKAREVRMVKAKRGREKGRREEIRREGTEKGRTKEKKPRKKRTMKVKKIAKEWDIWDKEEKVAKFKEEAKKLVPQRFYK